MQDVETAALRARLASESISNDASMADSIEEYGGDVGRGAVVRRNSLMSRRLSRESLSNNGWEGDSSHKGDRGGKGRRQRASLSSASASLISASTAARRRSSVSSLLTKSFPTKLLCMQYIPEIRTPRACSQSELDVIALEKDLATCLRNIYDEEKQLSYHRLVLSPSHKIGTPVSALTLSCWNLESSDCLDILSRFSGYTTNSNLHQHTSNQVLSSVTIRANHQTATSLLQAFADVLNKSNVNSLLSAGCITKLESFDLSFCFSETVTPREAKHSTEESNLLCFVSALRGTLRSFSLAGCSSLSRAVLEKISLVLPLSLDRVNLSHCKISRKCALSLAQNTPELHDISTTSRALQRCRSVRSLCLAGCESLSDESLSLILVVLCRSLISLNISSCSRIAGRAFTLSYYKSLLLEHSLRKTMQPKGRRGGRGRGEQSNGNIIKEVEVSDGGNLLLVFDALKTLDVSNCSSLLPETFQWISLSCSDTLVTLVARNCKASLDDFVISSSFGSFQVLSTLDISGCEKVTDTGLKSLSYIMGKKSTNCSCMSPSTTAAPLSNLKGSPTLRNLNVSSLPKVTHIGVYALLDAFSFLSFKTEANSLGAADLPQLDNGTINERFIEAKSGTTIIDGLPQLETLIAKDMFQVDCSKLMDLMWQNGARDKVDADLRAPRLEDKDEREVGETHQPQDSKGEMEVRGLRVFSTEFLHSSHLFHRIVMGIPTALEIFHAGGRGEHCQWADEDYLSRILHNNSRLKSLTIDFPMNLESALQIAKSGRQTPDKIRQAQGQNSKISSKRTADATKTTSDIQLWHLAVHLSCSLSRTRNRRAGRVDVKKAPAAVQNKLHPTSGTAKSGEDEYITSQKQAHREDTLQDEVDNQALSQVCRAIFSSHHAAYSLVYLTLGLSDIGANPDTFFSPASPGKSPPRSRYSFTSHTSLASNRHLQLARRRSSASTANIQQSSTSPPLSLPVLVSLRELCLVNWRYILIGQLSKLLERCPNIRTLHVRGTPGLSETDVVLLVRTHHIENVQIFYDRQHFATGFFPSHPPSAQSSSSLTGMAPSAGRGDETSKQIVEAELAREKEQNFQYQRALGIRNELENKACTLIQRTYRACRKCKRTFVVSAKSSSEKREETQILEEEVLVQCGQPKSDTQQILETKEPSSLAHDLNNKTTATMATTNSFFKETKEAEENNPSASKGSHRFEQDVLPTHEKNNNERGIMSRVPSTTTIPVPLQSSTGLPSPPVHDVDLPEIPAIAHFNPLPIPAQISPSSNYGCLPPTDMALQLTSEASTQDFLSKIKQSRQRLSVVMSRSRESSVHPVKGEAKIEKDFSILTQKSALAVSNSNSSPASRSSSQSTLAEALPAVLSEELQRFQVSLEDFVKRHWKPGESFTEKDVKDAYAQAKGGRNLELERRKASIAVPLSVDPVSRSSSEKPTRSTSLSLPSFLRSINFLSFDEERKVFRYLNLIEELQESNAAERNAFEHPENEEGGSQSSENRRGESLVPAQEGSHLQIAENLAISNPAKSVRSGHDTDAETEDEKLQGHGDEWRESRHDNSLKLVETRDEEVIEEHESLSSSPSTQPSEEDSRTSDEDDLLPFSRTEQADVRFDTHGSSRQTSLHVDEQQDHYDKQQKNAIDAIIVPSRGNKSSLLSTLSETMAVARERRKQLLSSVLFAVPSTNATSVSGASYSSNQSDQSMPTTRASKKRSKEKGQGNRKDVLITYRKGRKELAEQDAKRRELTACLKIQKFLRRYVQSLSNCATKGESSTLRYIFHQPHQLLRLVQEERHAVLLSGNRQYMSSDKDRHSGQMPSQAGKVSGFAVVFADHNTEVARQKRVVTWIAASRIQALWRSFAVRMRLFFSVPTKTSPVAVATNTEPKKSGQDSPNVESQDVAQQEASKHKLDQVPTKLERKEKFKPKKKNRKKAENLHVPDGAGPTVEELKEQEEDADIEREFQRWREKESGLSALRQRNALISIYVFEAEESGGKLTDEIDGLLKRYEVFARRYTSKLRQFRAELDLKESKELQTKGMSEAQRKRKGGRIKDRAEANSIARNRESGLPASGELVETEATATTLKQAEQSKLSNKGRSKKYDGHIQQVLTALQESRDAVQLQVRFLAVREKAIKTLSEHCDRLCMWCGRELKSIQCAIDFVNELLASPEEKEKARKERERTERREAIKAIKMARERRKKREAKAERRSSLLKLAPRKRHNYVRMTSAEKTEKKLKEKQSRKQKRKKRLATGKSENAIHGGVSKRKPGRRKLPSSGVKQPFESGVSAVSSAPESSLSTASLLQAKTTLTSLIAQYTAPSNKKEEGITVSDKFRFSVVAPFRNRSSYPLTNVLEADVREFLLRQRSQLELQADLLNFAQESILVQQLGRLREAMDRTLKGQEMIQSLIDYMEMRVQLYFEALGLLLLDSVQLPQNMRAEARTGATITDKTPASNADMARPSAELQNPRNINAAIDSPQQSPNPLLALQSLLPFHSVCFTEVDLTMAKAKLSSKLKFYTENVEMLLDQLMEFQLVDEETLLPSIDLISAPWQALQLPSQSRHQQTVSLLSGADLLTLASPTLLPKLNFSLKLPRVRLKLAIRQRRPQQILFTSFPYLSSSSLLLSPFDEDRWMSHAFQKYPAIKEAHTRAVLLSRSNDQRRPENGAKIRFQSTSNEADRPPPLSTGATAVDAPLPLSLAETLDSSAKTNVSSSIESTYPKNIHHRPSMLSFPFIKTGNAKKQTNVSASSSSIEQLDQIKEEKFNQLKAIKDIKMHLQTCLERFRMEKLERQMSESEREEWGKAREKQKEQAERKFYNAMGYSLVKALKQDEAKKIQIYLRRLLSSSSTPDSTTTANIASPYVEYTLTKVSQTHRNEIVKRFRMKAAIIRRQQATIGKKAGIRMMKFTVGQEETEAFEKEQNKLLREASTDFYTRMDFDIGLRQPVYIWTRRSLDLDKCAKEICLSHHDPKSKFYVDMEAKDYTTVSHPKLAGVFDAPLDPSLVIGFSRGRSPLKAISQLAVSYTRQDERYLTSVGYERLSPHLGRFGFADDMYLWIKRQDSQQQSGTRKKAPAIDEVLGVDKRHYQKPKSDLSILERAAEFLGLLSHELEEFQNIFLKIDTDKSGEVDVDEMLSFFQMKKDSFTESIFQMFAGYDNAASTSSSAVALEAPTVKVQLDFGNFLNAVSVWCMLGDREIAAYAYTLFDDSGKCYMSRDGLLQLITKLHGSHSRYIYLCDNSLGDKKETVTLPDFLKLQKQIPGLVHPLIYLQEQFQSKIMGKTWWAERQQAFQELRAQIQMELIEGKDPEGEEYDTGSSGSSDDSSAADDSDTSESGESSEEETE